MVREGRNYVAIGLLRGERVVVKKFSKATWANHIIYSFFRKTKGERAYRNALEILNRGMLTPRPICWSKEDRVGIYYCGYYVSAYVDGPTLREALEQSDAERRKSLIALYTETLVEMTGKEMLLCDSNASNFIIVDEDGRERLSMVDINRMVIGRKIRPLEVFRTIGRSGFTGDEFSEIARKWGDCSGEDLRGVWEQHRKRSRRNDFLHRLKRNIFPHRKK